MWICVISNIHPAISLSVHLLWQLLLHWTIRLDFSTKFFLHMCHAVAPLTCSIFSVYFVLLSVVIWKQNMLWFIFFSTVLNQSAWLKFDKVVKQVKHEIQITLEWKCFKSREISSAILIIWENFRVGIGSEIYVSFFSSQFKELSSLFWYQPEQPRSTKKCLFPHSILKSYLSSLEEVLSPCLTHRMLPLYPARPSLPLHLPSPPDSLKKKLSLSFLQKLPCLWEEKIRNIWNHKSLNYSVFI